ncbi:NADPH-dependent FMN reductase [Leptospira ilyithenensis]|uniref:NADPH-dependent oxidoreductase n=1 Tax=Leptospira ilyithenensis TaxID=2484901 RepID=A0A4R9LND7_9LEPT|nr:NAD(P)H-dependent oxidoreductase [Leptospira ilyithenensis]TGN08514.1 NADPH-dependent oxidoreductase [Leptospira ilyithenensis]
MLLKYVNTDSPLRLGVVLEKTGGLGEAALRWFMSKAGSDHRFKLDLIDLLDFSFPSGQGKSKWEPAPLAQRIASADAFVVITPEPNYGYPELLKLAIDSIKDEWNSKPMGFVSYGGKSDDSRTIEELRILFSELRVAAIRDSISFSFSDIQIPDLEKETYLENAAKSLLSELDWWGNSFRNARMGIPYPVLKY